MHRYRCPRCAKLRVSRERLLELEILLLNFMGRHSRLNVEEMLKAEAEMKMHGLPLK